MLILDFLLFALVSFAIFVVLMRLRKIAITPKSGPRVHRQTYRS